MITTMSKRFLIVDDDERFAELVAHKLSPFGMCRVAASGAEALETFEKQLSQGKPFDGVFMDIVMPGMDGHEVVQKMRAIEREQGVNAVKSFKLIMLTAHSDVGHMSRSFFDNLADAYLTKAKLQDGLQPAMREARLL